jgi:hypothetical protein
VGGTGASGPAVLRGNGMAAAAPLRRKEAAGSGFNSSGDRRETPNGISGAVRCGSCVLSGSRPDVAAAQFWAGTLAPRSIKNRWLLVLLKIVKTKKIGQFLL